jgi:hypothetical protein
MTEPSHYSYGQQTRHYFDRPHEAVPTQPIDSPSAWRANELTEAAWQVRLLDSHVRELESALATARSVMHDENKPVLELTRADFPLGSLAEEVARWRNQVAAGRGFLLVRGLPVERWSQEDCELLFWCLGLYLGRPGTQNVHGDLLGHVRDTGENAADPFVRLYRTASNIAYHCDAADVVALLCLQRAKRGGASRLVSSVTVYNELIRRRPDLVERLFEPFLLDIRNEDASGALRHLPIPACRFAAGRLRTFYHSDYFRSVVRHDDVPRLSDTTRELLDFYEKLACQPGLYLDMELEPGDIQWVSNHTVLHARTMYEDFAEPERKRHLLRLWLSVD